MNNILTNIQKNELKYDTLNNNIENKQYYQIIMIKWIKLINYQNN